MPETLPLLVSVVIFALVFDYINGFHDTANSIATVVSTRVLKPSQAVLFAAMFNLVGAFLGVEVAKTIGKGIVDTHFVTQVTVLSALIGAIIWNLLTWYFGIPSSSSHALVGGLCGATAAHGGLSVIKPEGVLNKILLPMVASPLIGISLGFGLMLSLYWILFRAKPGLVNRIFSKLQIVSAGLMALSHGSNDAQKTMGIITIALMSYYGTQGAEFTIPLWVVLSCALAMGLGTLAGGWRIIHTMGSRMIKLQPVHGFAAETTAALTILGASHFGMPISTTHTISTAIMGVGAAKRLSAVRWGIVGNILTAWVLTFPVSFVLGSMSFGLLNIFFHK